jgi:hypothetical protein
MFSYAILSNVCRLTSSDASSDVEISLSERNKCPEEEVDVKDTIDERFLFRPLCWSLSSSSSVAGSSSQRESPPVGTPGFT